MKLKIVLVGPCKSGKSAIANFLSDSTDNTAGDYRPTQGVRIVEFDIHNLNINNRSVKTEIELWDCSGDRKFQPSWPVMYRDAQGLVFIFDSASPDNMAQLDYFYECFINQSGLNFKNCLMIQHSKQSDSKFSSEPLPNQYCRIAHVQANVETDGNKLRTDFNNFVATLINGVQDRTEQDELNILTIV